MKINLIELHTPAKKCSSGKQVCVALIKNEADIISLWLAHVCELFDFVFIMDHQSTDGTREYLKDIAKKTDKIYLYSFDHPGYFQAEITNELARIASQEYPESWLFALDVDEFISVKNKTEFSALLKKQSPESILKLNWRNCIPVYLNDDNLLRHNFSCLHPLQPGLFDKVAVHSNNYVSRKLKFVQGNHQLKTITGTVINDNLTNFVNIYHIPIRSMAHFALKCTQGYIAYKQLPPERNQSGQGTHWFNMIEVVLSTQTINADLIRKYVVTYGQPNNFDNTNIYDLIDMGWHIKPFTVPIDQYVYANELVRKINFMVMAQKLLENTTDVFNLNTFVDIVQDNIDCALDSSKWQKESKVNTIYLSLPEKIEIDKDQQAINDQSEICLLYEFFSKAFTKREFPVLSNWEGHVPFFYCILNYTKPRRFVELGSQYGNSYFAACQISKMLNHSIECIAIDTWLGDKHTGKYQDNVFQEFNYIRSRNYTKAQYISKLFAEAVFQFEDGSIDLLHIDGLHTYEAVSEDYQTWLPKLSECGIIMFHDTQVKENDFGVWRLWAELQNLYPSIEFEHSHGLGVILVGKKSPKHIQRLFALFSNPEYRQLLKFFFSNIGAISPIK